MSKVNSQACRPRLAIESLSRDYPGIWKEIDELRSKNTEALKYWPDTCFIPQAIIDLVLFSGPESLSLPFGAIKENWEISRICALAAWRTTQGIYRFDVDVIEPLMKTPLGDKIPMDLLMRMPEWCIYVETPGLIVLGERIYGAWVRLDAMLTGEPTDLHLWVDCETPFPIQMELGSGGIEECINRRMRVVGTSSLIPANLQREICGQIMLEVVRAVIPLVLYICTQADDLGNGMNKPGNPVPKRVKGGAPRLFPPNNPTTWSVAVRMGNAIRHSRNIEGQSTMSDGLRNAPRAHIRRAHWHTSRIGPRKLADGTIINVQARDLVVRWQPPIAVNVVDVADLPTTIRPVH